MEESILITIQKLIGGVDEYSDSDPYAFNLIIEINTALAVLNQLGVGKEGFSITDDSETWDDFYGETERNKGITLDMVKSFVYLRVRKAFDPPISSVLMQSLNETLAELTWRITTKVELA